MDNDIKINNKKESSNKVQLFLEESLKTIRQDTPDFYDLNKEFAKTKTNKDYFVILLILGIIVFFGFGSLLVTSLIQASSRKVEVDISIFDDLNLKNVLDLAKKAQENLDIITNQKINRQDLYRSELSNIEQRHISELEVLKTQRISKASLTKKQKEIDEEYAGQKEELRIQYEADLEVINKSLDEARAQVESFDSKRVEEAREQKRILDNQQDLFDLERTKLKKIYEDEFDKLRDKMDQIQKENAKLKTDQIQGLMTEYSSLSSSLDPEWKDALAQAYLADINKYIEVDRPFQDNLDFIPEQFNVSFEDISLLKYGYEGLEYILDKILEIPFERGTQEYVLASLNIAFLTGNEEERILRNAIDAYGKKHEDFEKQEKELLRAKESLSELQKTHARMQETYRKNEIELTQSKKIMAETREVNNKLEVQLNSTLLLVASYEQFLRDGAEANGYDGYILGYNDEGQPNVYIVQKPTLKVGQESIKARIYHPPKTLIADVELILLENETYAFNTINLKRGKTIMPLDYILFAK